MLIEGYHSFNQKVFGKKVNNDKKITFRRAECTLQAAGEGVGGERGALQLSRRAYWAYHIKAAAQESLTQQLRNCISRFIRVVVARPLTVNARKAKLVASAGSQTSASVLE